MAVNLEPPRPENLLTIAGVRLGVARAGIRKPDRKDLLLVAIDEGGRVAGVFTRNRFAAPPVIVCRERLESGDAMRAIVVNTGVANAGTGEQGLAAARATCAAAAGRAANPQMGGEGTSEFGRLAECVGEVAELLAQAIVRDGEGATKFITITVDEGATREECVRVGKAIAHSPLVKTAFFASDPNLGRILAAIGNAGIADLDPARVSLEIGDVRVVDNGGRAASYTEEQGRNAMRPKEIALRVTLDRGVETATIWTCDFSYDYVKINADYRS